MKYLNAIDIKTPNVYAGVGIAYQLMKEPRNQLPVADLDTLLEEMCKIFEVDKINVLSHNRCMKYSYIRHLYVYVARQVTGASSTTLGRKMANRDHSTILHCQRTAEKLLETQDPRFMKLWVKYTAQSNLFVKPL